MQIDIDAISKEVMKELNDYGKDTAKKVKKAVEKTAKYVKAEIVQNSPEKTGTYKKNWKIKKATETPESLEKIIHSEKRYVLIHLLENGHNSPYGFVEGNEHVKPARDKGEAYLLEQLEKEL